jgi:hypothetical protein
MPFSYLYDERNLVERFIGIAMLRENCPVVCVYAIPGRGRDMAQVNVHRTLCGCRPRGCTTLAIMKRQEEDRASRQVSRRPFLMRFVGRAEEEEHDAMRMEEINIYDYARQLLEAHGDKAVAEAAQKACACEKRGDNEQAETWRHVEAALKLMRGPHES